MTDTTGGLYPFLDRGEEDPAGVLAEVRASTLAKAREVTELRLRLWKVGEEDLVRAARILAGAFRGGGKVLAFGNGGSATDAQDLAHDLTVPPHAAWRPLPALALVQDRGVVTAVGNDVGFENIFSRQVIAYGEAGDVAVGFSTSGESENVLRGLAEARARGMATVGFAGYEGGRMAEPGLLDAVVVAPSTHIPRIQEAHATAYHAILHMMHGFLEGEEAR
jgi:D-sedoheptulose 7-phosphate isomerase